MKARGRRNILTGEVVSDKMNKSISVQVYRKNLTLNIKNTLKQALFLKPMMKRIKPKKEIRLGFLKPSPSAKPKGGACWILSKTLKTNKDF